VKTTNRIARVFRGRVAAGLAAGLMTLAASCRTTYYGLDDAGQPALAAGEIVQKGSVKKLPNNAIAVIGKVSAPLRIIAPIYTATWEGAITVNGESQDLAVECRKVSQLLTVTAPDFRELSVANMPDRFGFVTFDIPSDRMVMKNEMPARLADFSINGQPFTVRLAGGQTPYPQPGLSMYALIKESSIKQRYIITGADGAVYASFSGKDYAVYRTSDAASVDDIRLAIGVYTTIPKICGVVNSGLLQIW